MEILNTILESNVTIAGAILALGIIFKPEIKGLLGAGTKKLLHSLNGGESHEERIEKIESNDIQHLESDIKELKNGQREIKVIVSRNETDIAVLKSEINNLKGI